MRYTPLTSYEQEDLRHRVHIESLPENFVFTSPRVDCWVTKIRLSVLPAGIPVHKIRKSASLNYIEFNKRQHMQSNM